MPSALCDHQLVVEEPLRSVFQDAELLLYPVPLAERHVSPQDPHAVQRPAVPLSFTLPRGISTVH